MTLNVPYCRKYLRKTASRIVFRTSDFNQVQMFLAKSYSEIKNTDDMGIVWRRTNKKYKLEKPQIYTKFNNLIDGPMYIETNESNYRCFYIQYKGKLDKYTLANIKRCSLNVRIFCKRKFVHHMISKLNNLKWQRNGNSKWIMNQPPMQFQNP